MSTAAATGMDDAMTTPACVVVFDLDGTLVDSSRDIHDALGIALQAIDDGRQSAAHDEEALEKGGHGMSLENFFRFARPHGSREGEAAFIQVYRKHYYAHLLDHTLPFPGVMEGLRELADLRSQWRSQTSTGLPQLRLTVATAKRTETAHRVVNELGMASYFDVVMGSDGLPTKPDPAVILAVFSQLGRLPKGRLPEAAESRWDLMVGDTEFDILAGKAAGVTTCAVRWSEIPHERLLGAGPDHFVEEFAQIVALIKQQVQALRS